MLWNVNSLSDMVLVSDAPIYTGLTQLKKVYCTIYSARKVVSCVSDRGSPIKIEKRGGIILKIKFYFFMITVACFALFYHVEFAYCGMFDFLDKGITKSWKIHKENLHFCDDSLVVVEDGYKLLKIVNKKNKNTELKYGVWGFKLKIKITSAAILKSHLNKQRMNISYSLFDEDGFHISTYRIDSECYRIDSEWVSLSLSRDELSLDEFLSLEKDGFIEYSGQHKIDFEDIERVRKRKINIDGFPCVKS